MVNPPSARENLAQGFNCAESVYLAISNVVGLGGDARTRVATVLGEGVAGTGSTCGALLGALMVVGLLEGRDSPEHDDSRARATSRRIVERFEQEMGSILCRDLSQLDLSTPDGLRELHASGTHERVCARAVAFAEEVTLDVLGNAHRLTPRAAERSDETAASAG
jgi:C_GCAxxG_C_C family probable redox protein